MMMMLMMMMMMMNLYASSHDDNHVRASFASQIRWESPLYILSIAVSHDDNHDYASSASPAGSNGAIEFFSRR